MTRRRWIADEVSGNTAALIGEHAEHLAVVLRAQPGQRFDVAVAGVLRAARVVSVSPNRVEFELGQELRAPSLVKLTLLLAVYKFDRMEWAIEKCVELGVARVVPVLARRTDAHLARAAEARVDRWRRLALQASEQARRTVPAAVEAPEKLKQAVLRTAATRILLAETEEQKSLKEALQTHTSQTRCLPHSIAQNAIEWGTHDADDELLLAVGPEGGWTEDELTLFSEAGWISASLGPTILRAETAAIAATAIAFSELV
jgi:16S rRNA (uracil1498-N3)-methyltransferase